LMLLCLIINCGGDGGGGFGHGAGG
jgi:hypothetical protein